MLKAAITEQSVQNWKSSFLASSMAQPFFMSQQYPCSAGGRLLDAGHLDFCKDADAWDLFRLGLGASQLLKSSPCALCGQACRGHAHVLAVCCSTQIQRSRFLDSVDAGFAGRLRLAVPGDWPSALLTPHLEIFRLKAVVRYCAEIMQALRETHR